ncbi:glycosyltransferase family 4 protein [Actinoallomurus purpureus]|uniref:glycosyltransferase family 4 protein n=1 Tax=Actinoallomurus purpureus TaxID=478114 RepID=UPI002092C79E|nr:glycosyltransferase family 4 protein [Actinoallomurus purpureus]MCO6009030.1 glycosyltransferase family 4 protein [Actinoallomurus purpureus]
MKVSILLMNAYGMGGTIRATFNLADELALRHDVEIVSVFRHREKPFLPLSDRVTLTNLIDLRAEAKKWWRFGFASRIKKPSTLVHPDERAYTNFSAESDRALTQYLGELRTDVLITTRAALNIAAARLARDGITLVGQEHLHFGAHKPGVLEEIRRWYPKLDAVITLTDADHAEYSQLLEGHPTRVYPIGNGLPDQPRPQSRLDNRVVLAAGRLVKVKGYDRLLDAFAKVIEKRPDWKLRIYGSGTNAEKLSKRARSLDLHNNVAFMGPTTDIEGELAKASLHVITSRFEGFGMTIVEAFAAGVPVVSFDCPQGPREIITPGHDGILVPDGDIDAFADALLSLMDDPDQMRRLADNGRETALRYRISEVAARWDAVFTDLRRPGAR